MTLQPITEKHIREHIDFPASGDSIIDSAIGKTEVPHEDYLHIKASLQADEIYESADEVIGLVEEEYHGTNEVNTENE